MRTIYLFVKFFTLLLRIAHIAIHTSHCSQHRHVLYCVFMLVYFFSLKRISPPLNVYGELEKMLALRKLNWSYTKLSEEFKVPKTTIRYLVRRFGLAGKYNPPIRSRTTRRLIVPLYTELEERINPGKTYAEYLKDDQDRKWRRLTHESTK